MEQIKVKEIPQNNRPEERLFDQGATALSNAELLALVLRSGSRQENVIDLSNKILTKYNLEKLSKVDPQVLNQIPGIGRAKSGQIAALFELGRRTNSKISNGYLINTPKDVSKIFMQRLRFSKKEHFFGLYLDSQNHVIRENLISLGTLNSSLVHPREVFKVAVELSAAAIILVHNHPSGDPAPSTEDLEVTERLKECGDLFEIKVVDHVIIGRDRFYSFVENDKLTT